MKKIFTLLLIFCFCFVVCEAQYTVLKNLNGIGTGKYPQRNLTLVGKQLYGMTSYGGVANYGCIFTVDTNGKGFRDLYDFNPYVNANSPVAPCGSLIFSGNTLYGMTPAGSAPGGGAVFSIDTDGTAFTVLYGFGNGNDGSKPRESLTLIGNTLFGTTEQGGTYGFGTVFSISTTGNNYKVLLNFNDTNGYAPICNLVAVGKRLYGTAYYGGITSTFYGCIYSLDTNGANDTVLHTFDNTNGANPFGSVTISGNTIFGATEFGGGGNLGCIYSMKTNGSDFKVLYTGDVNAAKFAGDPIVSGSTLYEMSPTGGKSGDGTIISIDTNGSSFNEILSFSGTSGSYPGATPYGGLIQGGSGTFYGMTMLGGLDSGVVFKLHGTVLGVNEISASSTSVTLYPNPNNGQFNLSFVNLAIGNAAIVEIYNSIGQQVYSQKVDSRNSTMSINLLDQTGGIYLYRVLSVDNKELGSGKFIIQ